MPDSCSVHVQIEAVSFSGLDSVGGSLQGSKEEQQLQTELRRVYMHPTVYLHATAARAVCTCLKLVCFPYIQIQTWCELVLTLI